MSETYNYCKMDMIVNRGVLRGRKRGTFYISISFKGQIEG